MVNVTCVKCKKEGSLVAKQTKSKGITYQYWYVEHHLGKKIKWCYLGKIESLPNDYKILIHKDTQTDTQNIKKSDSFNLSFVPENNEELKSRGSLAWLGRQTHNLESEGSDRPEVAGSNPAPGTFKPF